MTLVGGINAVEVALRSGAGLCLLLRDGHLNRRQAALEALAREMDCRVSRIDADDDRLQQGVALEVRAAGYRQAGELYQLLETPRQDWLFLVLDGITDPRNLGACLRNAASFGVDGVIVPRDRSAALNEAAIRTASGGASLVPVFQVTNLARCLDQLKDANIWTVGTVLESDVCLSDVDLGGSIALVMGAEDTGLRQKTRQRCDFLARIPMPVPDLSLNVSVATGICLYEAHKQRAL